MLADHIQLLLRMFRQPAAAIGAILDQGSLLFASLAVLAVSFFYKSGLGIRFYMPLLVLAVFYVPGVLLLGGMLAPPGWRPRQRLPARLLAAAYLHGYGLGRRESSPGAGRMVRFAARRF